MSKFKTSCEINYYNEYKKRRENYEKACEESWRKWEIFEKDGSKENIENFFIAFKLVDIMYKEWQEEMEYVYDGI